MVRGGSFKPGASASVSLLPAALVPTAWAGEVLMGLRHAAAPAEGVQFHPESILTPLGPRLLANFLAGGVAP